MKKYLPLIISIIIFPLISTFLGKVIFEDFITPNGFKIQLLGGVLFTLSLFLTIKYKLFEKTLVFVVALGIGFFISLLIVSLVNRDLQKEIQLISEDAAKKEIIINEMNLDKDSLASEMKLLENRILLYRNIISKANNELIIDDVTQHVCFNDEISIILRSNPPKDKYWVYKYKTVIWNVSFSINNKKYSFRAPSQIQDDEGLLIQSIYFKDILNEAKRKYNDFENRLIHEYLYSGNTLRITPSIMIIKNVEGSEIELPELFNDYQSIVEFDPIVFWTPESKENLKRIFSIEINCSSASYLE